ncbi:MAG: ribonuclease HI family protein [Candidatus Nealsonbacteria bacterium]|nr:ribonuclease HI family protein [Candidatus Nealsonbacteria bacterium]
MERIIIYTDGGARGNPGPAAVGVVICDENGKMLKEYSDYLGERQTNNEAEYQAVIFALKKTKALYGKEKIKSVEIEIRSDSELLVKQLNGQYRVAEPRMQSLFVEVWNLRVELGRVKFVGIAREQNKEADRLVNEALDAKSQKATLF